MDLKARLDYLDFAKISRQAAAEGIVLLENHKQVLPLKKTSKIVLLGRTQFDTLHSGNGSGGLVHVPYVISINEAFASSYELEAESQSDYKRWLKWHPFNKGLGWGMEPWSQKEMCISRERMQVYSEFSDVALVVLGRTAGEDKDHKPIEKSYYLTKDELELLTLAREFFPKLVVVLNVGNIIDTSWARNIKPDALLYAWQGGCETGNAILDVISGDVNPSGHLTDTIAYNLSDYPAFDNFASRNRNFYQEDIYLGYRYFETFCPEKVQYPFGYGLSYTEFSHENIQTHFDGEHLSISVRVKNIGEVSGKAVVQVYLEAAQGALGKAKRSLVDFSKTELLLPKESCVLNFEIPKYYLASFDDSGLSGYRNAYVLEAGNYGIYIGFDVREAELIYDFSLKKTEVVEQLSEVMAPLKPFKRMRAEISKVKKTKKDFELVFEDVPCRTLSEEYYIKRDRKKILASNNFDKGAHYDFKEWLIKDISLDKYLSQFSNMDLVKLSRGIGMSPAGVTRGVAGAFGGVTRKLQDRGMPLLACADGPSGIRMDDGSMAFQVPIATALASSFDVNLNRKLYEFVALELRKNKIEFLLGPGMNIHRFPLCGRNFEYMSEDPLLTGKIAAAQVEGLYKWNTAGTVKHFVANNQESWRNFVDSVVSQRALREIYFKSFEIVVKTTELRSVMTAYNPINGLYAASNYELNTVVLRQEWGFSGIVMTDWWARLNWGSGRWSSTRFLGAMIRAQNDLNMTSRNAERNSAFDTGRLDLWRGKISRAELLRNARNICMVIRDFYHGFHELDLEVLNEPKLLQVIKDEVDLGVLERRISLDLSQISPEKNTNTLIKFQVEEKGYYAFKIRFKSDLQGLAQQNIHIVVNGIPLKSLSLKGSESQETSLEFFTARTNNTIKIFYSEGGLAIMNASLQKLKNLSKKFFSDEE